jgi:hypothetical protein
MAIRVIAATHTVEVEQAACNRGEAHGASLDIRKLVQATAAATVAERLPLVAIELGEGFSLPERCVFIAAHGPRSTNAQAIPPTTR